MVQQAATRVTDFLLERVGDSLRTVVVVKPLDFEINYLNDQLQQEYSKQTFKEVVNSFRLENPFFDPDIENYPVGERRALVHYHENAFVLQFPFSETETILISVTRDVGRDLLGFIEQCREIVHGEE